MSPKHGSNCQIHPDSDKLLLKGTEPASPTSPIIWKQETYTGAACDGRGHEVLQSGLGLP